MNTVAPTSSISLPGESIASPWRPLLSGPERAQALEAVEAIAAVADDAIRRWAERYDDPAGMNAASLACGRAGVALFYAYRAATGLAAGDDGRAEALLEETIDAMGEKALDSSLFCGFTGVAWVTEHLERMAPLAEADTIDGDPNAEIDEALLEYLGTPRADAEYDLIDGLVGIGVYALERLPKDSGIACAAAVVERLSELSRAQSIGVSWPTPPRRAPSDDESAAGEHFNLGVAHGIAGVVGFLGAACAAGIAVDRARPLLEGAFSWLLSRRLPEATVSCFSSYSGAGVKLEPARCAWCYGDPGIAVTLLSAARGLARDSWEGEALAIARHQAGQRRQRDDVRDAGLCHGSAGVGHLFNRLYQATGDEVLAEAARYWYVRALSLRDPGRGLGGFSTWSYERTSDGEWLEDPRFLTGVAGTGLALLAAATPVEPSWDRAMLMSIPPRVFSGA